MKKKPSISVFFPCYNDEMTIGGLVNKVNTVLPKISSKYEIIVVDDCSTDNSRRVLLELSKKLKNLKLVFHKSNRGYGGALRTGFKSCKNDLIFYTDGDGQYDPGELPLLLSVMTDDIDFVTGLKISRQDPTYRVVIGNLYSFAVRWLFWTRVIDIDCDFRLIRKTIIDKIRLESCSGVICIELLKKAQRAGARFRQISVHHYEREWGESQFFQPKRLLSTFFELISLWTKLMIIDNIAKDKYEAKKV